MSVPVKRTRLRLYLADDHAWGPGKIHALTDDGLHTRCGKSRQDVPGSELDLGPDGLTCKACIKNIESAEREARWRQLRDLEVAEREEATRSWWDRYDAYLLTPEWTERRAKVMVRAKGMCEGCGAWPATQVHHLSYAHAFEEFLWELAAVCDICHGRLHPNRQVPF